VISKGEGILKIKKKDMRVVNGMNLVNVRFQELSLCDSTSVRGMWRDLILFSA
jgi:hypothetical protein